MSVRKWYISQATGSFATLRTVISHLTLEEVLAALDLESQTQRRQTLIERLISRAVRLQELAFKQQLEEKYYEDQQRHQSDPERTKGCAQDGANNYEGIGQGVDG